MRCNYQEKIFSDFDKQTVEYIPAGVADDGKPRNINIYLPCGDTSKHRPFVIWFYGGGGSMDQGKDWLGGEWCPRGYGGAAPDYRDITSDKDKFTEEQQIQAIIYGAAALRFLVANHSKYGITCSKIFVTGTSAGGDTAVGLNTILDKILIDPMFADPVNSLYPRAEMSILCSATHPGACNQTFQPYIYDDSVPNHAHHGVLDTIIPIGQARQTLKAFTDKNIPATLVEYPDADHKLAGLQPVIAADLAIKFAGLMGIAPVNVNKPSVATK